MENIEYRTTVATTSHLFSEASARFECNTARFHLRASLMSYEECPKQQVPPASGVPIIVGKGRGNMDQAEALSVRHTIRRYFKKVLYPWTQ